MFADISPFSLSSGFHTGLTVPAPSEGTLPHHHHHHHHHYHPSPPPTPPPPPLAPTPLLLQVLWIKEWAGFIGLLSLSLTPPLSPPFSHPPSLTPLLSLSHTHTRTRTHPLFLTHPPSLSLSHTHTHTYIYIYIYPRPLHPPIHPQPISLPQRSVNQTTTRLIWQTGGWFRCKTCLDVVAISRKEIVQAG